MAWTFTIGSDRIFISIVSSAYEYMSEWISKVISLTYIKNSTGPRIDPCGTPARVLVQPEFAPFMTTLNVVVPMSDPPVPEFRLLLELPDLSSDSASAAEDFFPEPGSLSAWPGFVETFRPQLGGSPLAPFGIDSEVPCRNSGTFAPWILRARVGTKRFWLAPEPDRFHPQWQGFGLLEFNVSLSQ